MGIDVGVFAAVGGVVKHLAAGTPRRADDARVVGGDGDGTEPIVIGDVNFAGLAAVLFENDFGAGDSRVLHDLLNDIVSERMGLRARRPAGVGLGEKIVAAFVSETAFDLRGVAAFEADLSGSFANDLESRDGKIETKNSI